jgi:hypothetical protein
MKPALRIVPAEATSADILRELLPAREEAAQALAEIDRMIAQQSRLYAKAKGLAFVRIERLPAMLKEDEGA